MAVSDDISGAGGGVGEKGVSEGEGGIDAVWSVEDGGGWEVAEDASGLTFGRKAELMSPIPTKKSSIRTGYVNVCAYIGGYR